MSENHSKDYYRFLFNCSTYAIIGADKQGHIVSWNQAAAELFNADAAAMVGCHIDHIVSEEQRPELHDAVKKTVDNGGQHEFEIKHRKDNGETITLMVVIAPVTDEHQHIIGIAAWIRDISNRKYLQSQLLNAEKMASLGTLASGVAHHFNNIIGGVATFVDFALHSNNPQASRRALEMTAEAANRIGNITTSLLTFAEKDVRQFDKADLTEVVLTFAHLVEKPLSEKNITLELRLQPVPVYEVPGSRIHQMLGNLLDNAEKAMENNGAILIHLYRDGEDVVLVFSDTGSGIAPDVLPHIFEPFFTTHGTISGGDSPSSGLGLAVVHGIVSELGGTIHVSSRQGKGTTFTIRFPDVGHEDVKREVF